MSVWRLLQATALCMAALTSGCQWFCNTFCGSVTAAAASQPQIATLEIVPPLVHVLSRSPSQVVRLKARLKDTNGHVVSSYHAVDWAVAADPSGLVQTTNKISPSFTNFSSLVEVEIGHLSSGQDVVNMTAEIIALGLSAAATIRVYATAADVPEDRVTVPVGAGADEPSVLLVDAQRVGSCEKNHIVSFVGVAPVGDVRPDPLGSPCNDLALFSTGKAMVYRHHGYPFGWTNLPGDEYPEPPYPQTQLPDRLVVPVSVFIAVKGDNEVAGLSGVEDAEQVRLAAHNTAYSQATTDIAVASMLFDGNRAGIRFEATYKGVGSPGVSSLADIPDVGAGTTDCNVPRALANWNNANAVNVYYVDKIGDPSVIADAGARGYHCPYTVTSGPVMWISISRHSHTTLAHELGHALGLLEYPALSTNIMNNLAPDGPLWADARSRLTLGQLFWMNVDQGSWIFQPISGPRRPQSLSLDCTTLGVCPPVATDVAP